MPSVVEQYVRRRAKSLLLGVPDLTAENGEEFVAAFLSVEPPAGIIVERNAAEVAIGRISISLLRGDVLRTWSFAARLAPEGVLPVEDVNLLPEVFRLGCDRWSHSITVRSLTYSLA